VNNDVNLIQLELVRAGVVWTDGQGRDADQLAAAHAEAEANRIGCLFG
jgi:endonuclease YncB( thermonuclease family)